MIHHKDSGTGNPVILLHGFPFNRKIWETFLPELDPALRIITPDLPGFGGSELPSGAFSLSDVALSLNKWLTSLGIDRCHVVGHSLGGYVALAMVEQDPSLFSSLVLFHSTALPDTDEKKQSREKVLEFIERNGVENFTSNFIPPLFADPKHPAIEKVRELAVRARKEAVTGYTTAMKNRPDRTLVLRDSGKPALIISGEKDGGISPESVKKQASLSPFVEAHILPGIAHMGMFENPLETSALINAFIRASNRP